MYEYRFAWRISVFESTIYSVFNPFEVANEISRELIFSGVYKWHCIARYLIQNVTRMTLHTAISRTQPGKYKSHLPRFLLVSKSLSPLNTDIVRSEGSRSLNQSSFAAATSIKEESTLLVRHKSAAGLPANQAQSLWLDSSIGHWQAALPTERTECRSARRDLRRSIDGSINHVDGNACTLTPSSPLSSFASLHLSAVPTPRARGCNVHEESRQGGAFENSRHILSRIIYRHGVQALDLI